MDHIFRRRLAALLLSQESQFSKPRLTKPAVMFVRYREKKRQPGAIARRGVLSCRFRKYSEGGPRFRGRSYFFNFNCQLVITVNGATLCCSPGMLNKNRCPSGLMSHVQPARSLGRVRASKRGLGMPALKVDPGRTSTSINLK